MIQIATYKKQNYDSQEIEQYSLHDIRSLDEYEINIIDLSDINMWHYADVSKTCIDASDDFKSIFQMIQDSNMTNIVIILPQNGTFYYNMSLNTSRYYSHCELKNMLDEMTHGILARIYSTFSEIDLAYENTKTNIGDLTYEAAFYFKNATNVIAKSVKSNKATVIREGRVFLSTLRITELKELSNFLDGIGLHQKKEPCPEWMLDVKMFDDEEQEKKIDEYKEAMKKIQENIEVSRDILSNNMRLKSILYTSGDALVEGVFEILEEMLGCDLSGFVDNKKEDFLFEIGDTVFIGEIKGVNHNVKNENISQLDVHFQGYLDEHEEKTPDDVKAILIINHQKNKPINEREPVKDTQIKLAERNKSLIIETNILLNRLEKYRKQELTREEIIHELIEQKGLLRN